jgi:hypothetical protein
MQFSAQPPLCAEGARIGSTTSEVVGGLVRESDGLTGEEIAMLYGRRLSAW